MPTPSVVRAATNYNWLSSMQASQAMLKPEVDPRLTMRYGDQNMTGFMEMQGSMNPVSALEYTHYEDDWLHSIVTVGAQGGGAANAGVTLTVNAGYQYTYPGSAQSPYIVAGAVTSHPVRAQDTVQFPDGTKGIVTAVTSTQFTVYPQVLGESIPATLITDEIIITGNAHAEGSSQPSGRNSRTNKYTNNLQIFKDSAETTGSAMGQQMWVEVDGLNGQKGYLWYYKNQFDTYKRFKNEREITMLIGEKTTNTTFGAVSGQESTISTEGLIPFIENYGNIANYNLITGITLADFETMIETQLDANRGATENTLWVGISLRAGIEAFIRDAMKNGGIQYGAFSGDQKKAISFGFDSFQHLGYTFHMKTYDLFNYPQLLGAAGQPYKNMGLVVPADNRVVSLGPEKTKVSVPSLRMNYLSQKGAGGNYSRDFEEWLTGGANGVYTNTTDSIFYNVRSHCGFEAFAPNRFVKIINS